MGDLRMLFAEDKNKVSKLTSDMVTQTVFPCLIHQRIYATI